MRYRLTDGRLRARVIALHACVALVVAAWAGGVVAALRPTLAHESRAGDSGATPARWPAGSTIRRAPDRANVLVFAHPECPCTLATLEALRAEAEWARVPVSVRVVILGIGTEAGAPSPARASAAGIAGVGVVNDRDGVEARRFGAATSGHTVIYDGAGRLVFSGGLTPLRGHIGDGPGARALRAVFSGDTPPERRAPVYGCELFDPSSEATP